MKDLLTFYNAIIIDPLNEFEALGSITVDTTEGKILGQNIGLQGRSINCNGMHLAPGIIDIGVKICEPGERHKESFRSASESASIGGVTTLVTRADTKPAIDNPEILEFFKKRALDTSQVRIFPSAAITKKTKGKTMTEIGFLNEGGAIAFSDGLKAISDTKIYYQILKYAADFEALIIGHPQDNSLSEKTSATKSIFSSLKGISSTPDISEKIGLERDAALAENLSIRYHADQVTTKKGLESLRLSKQRNNNITAGTSIHHFIFNELDIANYRTFFKLKPPLRSNSDREALIEAIKDGTIDTICSMHTPQDEESKRLPYEEAAFGAVGLETILPASLSLYHNKDLELFKLFQLLSLNPAKILRKSLGTLSKHNPADLIIFDLNKPVKVDRFKLKSKSQNTPFDGFNLQGENLLTMVNGNIVFKSHSFNLG